MKRILTAIILLLVACASFADSTFGGTQQFASTLSPPETDYSVAYLGQIFGTVGNVLQGTSGQILGKMFYIFNEGVIVAAAIYLIMVIIQMVVRSAMEGSAMGRNANVPFVLLRIALGFALIIPSSSTGYSTLQSIFMRIVVQGVGLADQTWNAARNYIEYGGSLYIPPATLPTDTNIVANSITSVVYPNTGGGKPSNVTLAPVTQIFQDEVCMLASHGWAKEGAVNKADVPYYHPYFDTTTGTIYFPGVGDSGSTPSSSTAVPPHACGSVASVYYADQAQFDTWVSDAVYLTPAEQQNQLSQIEDDSFGALKQMVSSLMPAAQSYVETEIPGGYSFNPNALQDQSYLKNNSKAMFAAMIAYANLITPVQVMLSRDLVQFESAATYGAGGTLYESVTQLNQMSMMRTMKAEGWIMAGSMYWQLEQMNAAAQTISISMLFPGAHTINNDVFNRYNSPLVGAASEAYTYYAPDINLLWMQYVGAQQNSAAYVTVTSGGASTSGNILVRGVAGESLSIVRSAVSSMNDSSYNPIVTLMTVGMKLLEAAIGLWVGAVGLSVGIAIAAGVCTASQPSGVVFKAALTWVKSLIMLIMGLLLVPGAILCYYVPLYPYAIFTFAAIGWFLMVIEGMAAAPLVCMGMTHPENHDFMGKSEQALMLMLGIFIRPALMIIGLIAAMVISFVAFHMLNTGFFAVLNSLGNEAVGSAFLVVISMALVMIIFGIVTMELIEQCYKLIFQLPNTILQWIGSPSNQMAGDMGHLAGAMKGGASAGGGGAKEFMGSSGVSGDMLGGYQGAKEAKKKKQAENDGGNKSGIEKK